MEPLSWANFKRKEVEPEISLDDTGVQTRNLPNGVDVQKSKTNVLSDILNCEFSTLQKRCEVSVEEQPKPTRCEVKKNYEVRLVATRKCFLSTPCGLITIDEEQLQTGDRVLLCAELNDNLNGVWEASVNEWIKSPYCEDAKICIVDGKSYKNTKWFKDENGTFNLEPDFDWILKREEWKHKGCGRREDSPGHDADGDYLRKSPETNVANLTGLSQAQKERLKKQMDEVRIYRKKKWHKNLQRIKNPKEPV